MTRHHTLHAPRAGIRLAVTTASTIVLDPEPDEHARRHNLAREPLLIAAAIVMTVVSMYLLRTSEPHERPWTLAAGLLLAALACHAARPAHRTVPASLLEVLEPLRTATPVQPRQVQQLVWEACGLMAAEARPDTPSCPNCADRIAQIQAQLRTLTTTTAPPRPVPGDSTTAMTAPTHDRNAAPPRAVLR